MSITDELREFVETHLYLGATALGGWKEAAFAIADRIDEAHKHAIAYVDDRDPETMGEHGWVRLPKDADGEYIQPSDIPYLTKANDGKRLAFCPSLELRQDGTWRLAGWTLDRYRISKPTVEGILREFAEKMAENTAMYVAESWDADERDEADAAAVAEYAKRLRLVGEGE